MQTNRNSTRRSLLVSATALILSIAMLVGTTFAWFTDSASTGVNKIQAGNLDVEVDYSKDGTNWRTIEGTESLFSDNLWEPGHTEHVYLKVKNAGTLSLKYKVMVTPVSENGGINVYNENFKLSDYLKFGTTEPSTNNTTYADRAAARDAIGEGVALNGNGLTKESTIIANEADQYFALVVYMPENVDNHANAKPGTTAPSIDLGIKVVATQVENEEDSFGHDYDAGAVNGPEYYVGPAYNYFPQILKTESVNPTGDTTITATGKLNATDTSETTLATVTVPNVAVADDVSELTVTVKPQAATNPNAITTIQTETAAGRETANFDIKVSGIKVDNTTPIPVTVYVGTGLSSVKAFHNGTEIADATYNSETGMLSFATESFSDFTVSYDAAVAAIGTKTYGSLELAMKAVKDGETITILKNSAGNGIVVNSGSNFTVNFNSYKYVVDGSTVGSSGTETNGFQLLKDSTLVFKNGTIQSSKAGIIIQNYSNLTLDNMTLDGSSLPNHWWDPCYVLSNNNGNVTIKDTTISTYGSNVAFDVCRYSNYVGPHVTVEGNSVINGKVEISSSGTKEGAVHKLTVTGGTFNGQITKSSSPNFVGDIKGGTFSSNPTNYLANGYNVNEENGRYVVYAGTIVCTAEELQNILTAYTASGAGDNVVSIANDLRLADGETWTPARVQGYTGAGVITVNGNGHTIYGLNAPLFAGGFAGNSGIIVNDLTIDGAIIDDTNADQGLGAFICSIDSMPTIELNNCHLKSSTITSTGDVRVGGLIGWSAGYNNPNDGPVDTYITITNCSVIDCNITANGSVGAIIGHAGNNPATYHTITNCTVKNTKLHSTDDGGWRVGVVVGTANVGKVTISGTTESGNTLSQVGKTAPEHSNLYGRFVPDTTGELTIDGSTISNS